jgi:hypothetical protein
MGLPKLHEMSIQKIQKHKVSSHPFLYLCLHKKICLGY